MDIFEQVQRNGGTYTERRRQKIGRDEYRHIVIDYSRRFAVVTFFLSLAAVFLLNALAIYAISPERLFWLFRPGIEWALMLVVAFINGSIAFLYNISVRMNEFVDLAFEPTERTAQISPETSVMEATGANTQASTIPYNTAQNSRDLRRELEPVTVRGFRFHPRLLNALGNPQCGLNKTRLIEKLGNDREIRFNGKMWEHMRNALFAQGLIENKGSNYGWVWTASGNEWLKSVLQPPPPQT